MTVLRTGHLTRGQFFESQGGSLIQSRAIHPDATEMVVAGDDLRAFRILPNTLGDGFIEAIPNDTITEIRDNQPAGMRGTAVVVPVLEANGRRRIFMTSAPGMAFRFSRPTRTPRPPIKSRPLRFGRFGPAIA